MFEVPLWPRRCSGRVSQGSPVALSPSDLRHQHQTRQIQIVGIRSSGRNPIRVSSTWKALSDTPNKAMDASETPIRKNDPSSSEEGSLDAEADPDHPIYHVAPKSGWLNDGNGFIYYKGRYHMCVPSVRSSHTWRIHVRMYDSTLRFNAMPAAAGGLGLNPRFDQHIPGSNVYVCCCPGFISTSLEAPNGLGACAGGTARVST